MNARSTLFIYIYVSENPTDDDSGGRKLSKGGPLVRWTANMYAPLIDTRTSYWTRRRLVSGRYRIYVRETLKRTNRQLFVLVGVREISTSPNGLLSD